MSLLLMARSMARGMVWVFPWTLPAKVTVAPYSPSARAKERRKGGGEAGRGEGQEHFEGDFCGFSAFDEGDFFVFAGNSLQGGDCGGNEEG